MLPIIPRIKKVFKNKFLPGKQITLMPFTNGQEASLLMIKDSDNLNDRFFAIKDIIKECSVEKIDVDKLPLFLIEWIFLKLREISNGEIINLTYICKQSVNDEDCNGRVVANLDISKFNIKEYADHNNIIMITDTIGIKLKYPTLESLANSDESDKGMLISSIESIFDGDQVWDPSEYTIDDLNAFYDSIPLSKKADIIKSFFNKIPHINYETQTKCPKCGFEYKIEFNSLDDVFN